jgi:hypothetical protein
VVSCPGTAERLDAAAREGAEVIGGIDPTTLDANADGPGSFSSAAIAQPTDGQSNI